MLYAILFFVSFAGRIYADDGACQGILVDTLDNGGPQPDTYIHTLGKNLLAALYVYFA